MSRRSLRLHTTTGQYGDDSLDSSLYHVNHSASFRSGGVCQGEYKVLKSRRSQQHSVSCSQSLLLSTPRRSQLGSQPHNSSLHSLAPSDASLLSSMLDESCIAERTLVGGFWGLDDDAGELKDGAAAVETSLCGVNGDVHTAQTQTSMLNGTSFKDCTIQLDRREAFITNSSPRYGSSSGLHSASSLPAASPPSTVYAREKIRKNKPGLLGSLWKSGVLAGRRAAAWWGFISLFLQNLLLRRPAEVKVIRRGVASSPTELAELTFLPLQIMRHSVGESGVWSVLGSCLDYSRRGAGVVVSVLTLLTQAALKKANEGRQIMNGGDDCKAKQHYPSSKPSSSSPRTSWSHQMLGALWLITCYTGSSVLWLLRRAGSAGSVVARWTLSVLWLAAMFPGKAAEGAFWLLGAGRDQLVTLMSLLNVFALARCLRKPLNLVLFLLLSVVLLALWHLGLFSLLTLISAVNITEWRMAYSFTAHDAAPLERASDGQPSTSTPLPPADSQSGRVLVSVDSERLAVLEQKLAQLWDTVEGGARSQEQQYNSVLGLYQALREQLDTRTDRDSVEQWVSGLLDERLRLLKVEIKADTAMQRETRQSRGEPVVVQQQLQESRLAHLEVQLQTLASKTEEVQRRQEDTRSVLFPVTAPVPLQVSMGLDSNSHHALLAEVKKLEAALGSIRQDLQGVMGCQGTCDHLDTLHDMVSEQVAAQVRQELWSLFYGSDQAGDDQPREKELPEPLVQWLSERFVSGADLQASLASLELSVLQNVSLQLEESRARQETFSAETVTQTVMDTVGATGMSEEQVQLMVKNALNLYSQDRIGLADYALESGGGSILSTRCSETYGTKTALMSLFGFPLWYFSQSPRVVIQPDAHPGNCWAFQGSQGYLVIRLSMRIVPLAFSLEHLPKALTPTGNISSAPRHFTVYGLEDESQEQGKLLGSYTYQEEGEALQTYPVTQENDQAYQIIEVQVLSNWGHPEYTCLYRIRVHGQPSVD